MKTVGFHTLLSEPSDIQMVGMPGIEPGLYEPESYVLPVYYIPKRKASSVFETIAYRREKEKRKNKTLGATAEGFLRVIGFLANQYGYAYYCHIFVFL